MIHRSMADRVGGGLAICMGILAITEAFRLYPQRISPFVGDHVMFGLLGSMMVIGGLLLIFVIRIPHYKVEFPRANTRNVMLIVFGLLLIYRFLLPYLGYLFATFIVSAALFKVMGSYKWYFSLLFGALLTGAMYGIFIVWLQMSFPSGGF